MRFFIVWEGVTQVESATTTNLHASRGWRRLSRKYRQGRASSMPAPASGGSRTCVRILTTSPRISASPPTSAAAALQTGSWDQSKLDIVSDITSIPEPNESFDAIMCIEVLEHVPSPILAIKEFSRLLRSGGHLIITAPFCSLTHLAPYHFYSGFNKYFYQTHLPAHGFEIIELQENGNFFEYLAQEIRRIPSMAELYAKDRPDQLEDAASTITLNMLERLSREGQTSAEILHYGHHVYAIKK